MATTQSNACGYPHPPLFDQYFNPPFVQCHVLTVRDGSVKNKCSRNGLSRSSHTTETVDVSWYTSGMGPPLENHRVSVYPCPSDTLILIITKWVVSIFEVNYFPLHLLNHGDLCNLTALQLPQFTNKEAKLKKNLLCVCEPLINILWTTHWYLIYSSCSNSLDTSIPAFSSLHIIQKYVKLQSSSYGAPVTSSSTTASRSPKPILLHIPHCYMFACSETKCV